MTRAIALLLLFSGLVACSKDHSQKQDPNAAAVEQLTLGPAEGNERGNGAEDHWHGEGTAWFVDGNRTIKYCIQVDPSFGVDEERVREVTAKSFEKWSSYIKEKNIGWVSEGRLATKSELMNVCDGKEDLILYFGVRNSMIEREAMKFVRPWAFGIRTAYDIAAKWGKGFVWFREINGLKKEGQARGFPNWEVPGSLESIVLHEIGHIYGTGHVRGTIMRADITSTAGWGRIRNINRRRLYTEEIDQEYELVTSQSKWTYHGVFIEKTRENAEANRETYNFKRLMNRTAKGTVSAQVLQHEGQKLELVIKDDESKRSFPMEFSWRTRTYDESPYQAFRILVSDESAYGLRARPYTQLGTFTTASGEVITVIVTHNLSAWSPIHQPTNGLLSNRMIIQRLDGKNSVPLFHSQF